MKKNTFFMLLTCGFALAQTPTNYSEVSNINNTITTTTNEGAEAVITRVDNNRLPLIDTYTAFADFDVAVTGNCSDTTLTSEDFTGGPAAITICGVVISSDGGGCFDANEIEEGFSSNSSGDDMVYISPGAIGNVDALIGAATFTDFTVINFDPEIYAIAMDIWENNDPITTVRVFGNGGALIETLEVDTPTNAQTFFGVISDEPISSIELEGMNGSGELFGNFFYGADCLVLSVDDNLKNLINVSPNPASDVLNIQTPASIEVSSINVFDALGKSVNLDVLNGQITISSLNSGVYFLQINTTDGTLTKKFVKK